MWVGLNGDTLDASRHQTYFPCWGGKITRIWERKRVAVLYAYIARFRPPRGRRTINEKVVYVGSAIHQRCRLLLTLQDRPPSSSWGLYIVPSWIVDRLLHSPLCPPSHTITHPHTVQMCFSFGLLAFPLRRGKGRPASLERGIHDSRYRTYRVWLLPTVFAVSPMGAVFSSSVLYGSEILWRFRRPTLPTLTPLIPCFFFLYKSDI